MSDDESAVDPFSDTPEDYRRKMNRALGLVEDVPCENCGTVLPFRKMNLFDPKQLAWDHPQVFLCDPCCDELIHEPAAKAFREKIKENAPEIEDTMVKLALWSEDESVRAMATRNLLHWFEHGRGGQDPDQPETD